MFENSGQLTLALELVERSADRRISHWKRQAMLRYASEVIGANELSEDRLATLKKCIYELSEYRESVTHREIKVIVKAIAESLRDEIERRERLMKRGALVQSDIPF